MTTIRNDKHNREVLSEIYDEIRNLYQNLPKRHKMDLDHFLSEVEKQIDMKKKDLRTSNCTILIAGELNSFNMLNSSSECHKSSTCVRNY